MKLERSKRWWLARAAKEGSSAVGAGLLSLDPQHEEQEERVQQPSPAEDARIAFGKFVELMRRRLGFSVEQLAQEANLDVSELLVIEDDLHYLPEPRTVYQLAQTFKVSQQRLMQLAGLAEVKD